jgi:hypothetical protein
MKSLWIAIAISNLAVFGANAATGRCERNPAIIGKCTVIHGRLHSAASGLILWHVGTSHLMRAGDSSSDLPPELSRVNDSTNDIAYGDFEICPLEKERPGFMGAVCIEKASKLVFTKDFVEKPKPAN